MKLTVIGGGSTYTPELIHGFLTRKLKDPGFNISRISLYDIDARRLAISGEYSRALSEVSGLPFEITLEKDLHTALIDSSFVVIQIRTGGNEQRAKDEEFTASLGLVAQETTGLTGFLKAYRTIPVIQKIGASIRETAPHAWVINFTNPAGIMTAVLLAEGLKRVAGLCNVPIFVRNTLIRLMKDHLPHRYGTPLSDQEMPRAIQLEWGGLNHLSWVFDVITDGVSVMEELINVITSESFDDKLYYPMNREHVLKTRTIPSPYLRYYTDTDKILREQKEQGLRSREVLKIERNLLNLYQRETERIRKENYAVSPDHNYKETLLPNLPEELSRRGGADYSKLAVRLIEDIRRSRKSMEHILNIPGNGTMFGNPGDIVEVPVELDFSQKEDSVPEHDLRMLPRYPRSRLVHQEIRNLVDRIREYENFTIRAGLYQDGTAAEQAQKIHPLIGPGFQEINSFPDNSFFQ